MREDIIERLGKKVLRGFVDTDVNVVVEKDSKQRNEGDIWMEHDKTWTVKNGTIVSYKPFETEVIPLFCPKCKKSMKHDLDEKIYQLHKHCYNCQVEFETTLKIEGKFEEYEKNLINENLDSLIAQLLVEKQEFLNGLDKTNKVFNSDGQITEETDSSMINVDKILKEFEEKENYLKSCKQT